jgi:hypothetical protein
MAYSPHNAIPPHILSAAVQRYVQTDEPIEAICADLGISAGSLHRERRARGLPARPRHDPPPPRWRSEAKPDRYAAEPQTPKQRAVWRAWRAEPNAGPSRWAELSGATPGYASRLVGHWEAMDEGRGRLEAELRPEPARCPHCGGALGEARRGG